jgi:hypothetical protein
MRTIRQTVARTGGYRDQMDRRVGLTQTQPSRHALPGWRALGEQQGVLAVIHGLGQIVAITSFAP